MSTRTYVYGAFGLTVTSDVELPALGPPGANGSRVAVRVSPPVARTIPSARSASFVAGMERMWRSPEGWLLRYEHPDGRESWTMRVAPTGDTIDVERTRGIALGDLVEILQSVGLASALQLQGSLLLHACAVDTGGHAVLVAGPTGSGKSTVAAAFVREGFALLSDDVAAIKPADGTLVVYPGPPRLRITPQSARPLGWDPDALPRVFANQLLGDKRRVELSVGDGSFCAQPREIAAIFVLGQRASMPAVESVSPGEALRLLRANGYRDALLDRAQHAERFPLMARVVREIPIHTVNVPDDYAALTEVVHLLAHTALREPRTP